MPDPQSPASADPSAPVPPPRNQVSPLKTLIGAIMAGLMALPLSRLTTAIAQSFAAHPLLTTNQVTINISVAVRTLVVALGLMGLTIQLIIQGFFQGESELKQR
jgi:hypothetical protein